ncbi:hypothetical protein [Aestuariimicrobium sp. Y1814]|uniref:hypothetical protein n=1 Tax=Aestuariimicrobium sp. Y1814 TaxID=3418742 RepID=UPI003DA6F598
MTSPRWTTRLLAALAAGVVLLVSGCGSGEQNPYGQRIQGTGVSTGAPLLPEGDSWDELGTAGTDEGVRVYTVERDLGTDVTISVTAPSTPGADDGLQVQLTDAAGNRCSSAAASSYASVRDPVMSATVESTRREGDQCLTATRLLLSVSRSGEAEQATQVRIRLFTVAGVEDKDYPEHDVEHQLSPISVGNSTPGEPGSWLDDAQVLEPNQTVSGSIGTGVLHTYRIGLEWGQGMQVQLVFPDPPPSVRDQVGEAGLRGGLYLVNPAGEFGSLNPVWLSPGGATDATLDPAFYVSRSLANLPGYYTLVVSVSSTKETTAVLPYQLIASPFGATNNGLGPQVVYATSSSGLPEGVLWSMLVVGVLLIIAGMAQVTLHRQQH